MPATVRVTGLAPPDGGGLFAESVARSLRGAKNADTTRGCARATGKTFETLDHSISGFAVLRSQCGVGVHRGKVPFPNWCESRPETVVPVGSNRSG